VFIKEPSQIPPVYLRKIKHTHADTHMLIILQHFLDEMIRRFTSPGAYF